MDTQKNDEKNIVLELKRQLGRMMVQVDYMYRNDREMSRLDLDVMMERTRDLYDLLCDYQANDVKNDIAEPESHNTEINEGGELINRDVDFEIETPISPKDDPDFCDDEHEIHHPEMVDRIPDNIVDEPVKCDEPVAEDEDEDWEDEDDEMFRVETVEQQNAVVEDNSLAAKLQRTPVNDIRAELGINDKMMIINDLFKGSVERFNKSIDALNEFPTLSGSRIYLSELQIELQWDVESPAYKLLYDLVERRFI